MINNRINKIASYLRGNQVLCDIGCDHGYTIKTAFQLNKIKFAYALDINEGPLQKARETMSKAQINKVEFILSDGLKNFNHDFDVAVISGMGGRLIRDILKDSWSKFYGKDLILEPQGNNDLVRRFLADHNYQIISEAAFYDAHKYYEIIYAQVGSSSYDLWDYEFGPINRVEQNEAFRRHYRQLLDQKEKAILKATNKNDIFKEIIKYRYALGDLTMEKKLYDEANFYTKMYVDDRKRDLVVIFPGGGYNHTSNREAENIGIRFNALGMNVLVFHYRELCDLAPSVYEKIATVLAKELASPQVDKIYFNGYSAGGHVALELGLHLDLYHLPKINGLILCYPVVSSSDDIAHKGSFNNLLGANLTSATLKRYSEELEVNESSPRMFIWHTATDQSVPVENSLRLAQACLKNKVEVSLHIYPIGHHGLGLADASSARNDADIVPICQSWFELMTKWLALEV